MVNRKRTKGQTIVYKTQLREPKVEQHEPHQNNRGELKFSGRDSNYQYTSDTLQNLLEIA
jgi:hypothetical protein